MQENFCLGEALKNARNFKNISASELCRLANIPKSSLSDWENGKTQPSAKSFLRILDVLDITANELIRFSNTFTSRSVNINKKSNSIKIPVLGSIPAGIPIEAVQDIIDYEEISEEMAFVGEYFALKVKGNSMSPSIQDGDIVIIRKQDNADSGKICVVMINGNDATLKQIKKDSNGIWILPHNPNADFKPTFYSNKEIEELPVKVIGVAVEIRRNL